MSVHRPWSHETELAAEASSVSRARTFVAGHLRDHALGSLVDDIELVVSELATNAVMHAGSAITVTLRAFEQTVLLEVLDGAQTGPTVRSSRTLDTDGRGMAIVQALSRDWGVNARGTAGKSVWAAFEIEGARCRQP